MKSRHLPPPLGSRLPLPPAATALLLLLVGGIPCDLGARANPSLPPGDASIDPSMAVSSRPRFPTRLSVARGGEVAVSDPRVGSVFLLDPDLKPRGEIRGLDVPLGVALDDRGRIYVGNRGRGNVEVYGADGSSLPTASRTA